jgi:hypothetical protein
MKEFEFYVDKKITTWLREKHSVKAKTQKEAIDIMTKSFKKDLCNSSDTFYAQERMYDTDEYMSVLDNNGQSTAELYADTKEGDEFIIDNLNNTEN